MSPQMYSLLAALWASAMVIVAAIGVAAIWTAIDRYRERRSFYATPLVDHSDMLSVRQLQDRLRPEGYEVD
jgi:hypothetical protein